MKNTSVVKNGLLMLLLLVAYFMIMRAFELIRITEFRLFNVFIIIGVVAYHIYSYKKEAGENFDYFKGFGLGLQSSAIGIISFSLFMALYCSFDNTFMQAIKDLEGLGRFLNPATVAIATAMEGLGMGLLATYTSLQILKPANNANLERNYN